MLLKDQWSCCAAEQPAYHAPLLLAASLRWRCKSGGLMRCRRHRQFPEWPLSLPTFHRCCANGLEKSTGPIEFARGDPRADRSADAIWSFVGVRQLDDQEKKRFWPRFRHARFGRTSEDGGRIKKR